MLRSRLKKAEKFADWITGDVLPSIRKYGSYKLIEEHKKELHNILDRINFLQEENKKLKLGQCKIKYPRGGVVYVIDYSNKYEEIYRIGMTGNMKARKQLYDTHTLHNHRVVHISEFDCPLQLETCIRSLLYKYRYYQNKKDFYECKLSTIKSIFIRCIKNIKEINAQKSRQKGGSKTDKKQYIQNMIDKKLVKLKKEKCRVKIRINKLKMKILNK